jgi:hypothetical protein
MKRSDQFLSTILPSTYKTKPAQSNVGFEVMNISIFWDITQSPACCLLRAGSLLRLFFEP